MVKLKVNKVMSDKEVPDKNLISFISSNLYTFPNVVSVNVEKDKTIITVINRISLSEELMMSERIINLFIKEFCLSSTDFSKLIIR